jgi:hypothetical protein
MRASLLVVALLVILSIGGPAPSAQELHMGAGWGGCGEWLKARDDLRKETGRELDFDKSLRIVAMESSWVQGFLFGAAAFKPTVKEAFALVPESASIQAFIDKHCRNQPLDQIFQSAMALQKELADRLAEKK